MYFITINSESYKPYKVKHIRNPVYCIIGSNTCFLTFPAMFSKCTPSVFPDKGVYFSFLTHFFPYQEGKVYGFLSFTIKEETSKGA